MRYMIIGAGAVGGVLGGRLAEAGHDVVLVARGAQYEALRAGGLRLVTPDGPSTRPIPVVDRPEALELTADDVLVLAVKTQDSTAALDAWSVRPVAGGSTAGERLPLICAQNGVESERLALRRFRRVYGMCVWLPATFVEPGEVLAAGTPLTGVLHLGRYPAGTDETARLIAADLEKSKLLAPVVHDVMRWKYGKLLSNLANAIEAVTGPLTGQGASALLERALAEGRAVLAAAGIDPVSQEDQAAARAGLRFEPFDGSPRGCGSSWQSLSRGTGTIEADYLNGEIVLLGRLHGVPTPVNDVLRRTANTFARERREPGSMPVAELVALVDAAT
ncbi:MULTISPECIES: ketopantoate reductase family protein [unclassified Streptomyces]|uniref:ketopantoate reductase family protein n=1 Tax=unclassified Streptomyces TaxID=2593676 RepID=UPI002E0EBF0C|nr:MULTISPECIES: 2-dehydropantoate 2-reductase N-terminal domain-containing protein [unclassified Streptomyces]WSJ35548.1 ketopantoate reductase family protein [Streptomyces sp. NBC_01321]WSP61978.1 ketopantoate reductase family protein [Streptomyces sp. NBC_01240]